MSSRSEGRLRDAGDTLLSGDREIARFRFREHCHCHLYRMSVAGDNTALLNEFDTLLCGGNTSALSDTLYKPFHFGNAIGKTVRNPISEAIVLFRLFSLKLVL